MGIRYYSILDTNREAWVLTFNLTATISRRKIQNKPFNHYVQGRGKIKLIQQGLGKGKVNRKRVSIINKRHKMRDENKYHKQRT